MWWLWFLGCRSPDESVLRADTVHLMVSGHAYEVLLLDDQGEMLHRWAIDPAAYGVSTDRGSFRRAWLQPDGGLLALIEYGSLWRLTVDSEVEWVVDEGNHHDIAVTDEGITSLTAENTLSTYSLDGRHLSRIDVGALLSVSPTDEDPLHLNSVFAMVDGALLLSSRATSSLFVLDEGVLTFSGRGDFVGQHDAQLLGDGRVLLLDNGTPSTGSRPLELTFPALRTCVDGRAHGGVHKLLWHRAAPGRWPHLVDGDDGRSCV